ncbi:MAG: DNA-3-methyladenine glycosylase I [Acidobacteria bacterium]|nr:DNA-3-methyladenine glycosylase I [Acidobacteriota bacterium]
MASYCHFCRERPEDDVHRRYHDDEYGRAIEDDDELFARLILEINQAGLSWETILRKQPAFRAAYSSFAIDKVAAYGDDDRARLLADAGIVRNRLKVDAAIHNARRVQELRSTHGSFKAWIDLHHPRPLEAWVKLFRRTFKFCGSEIVKEFLMSTGYLPDAHDADCYMQPKQ